MSTPPSTLQFSTTTLVLTADAHHRQLMNKSYLWISEHAFFSPSFFSKGLTGIRFAEHQRCYIRSQTRTLPTVAEVEAEEGDLAVCVPHRFAESFHACWRETDHCGHLTDPQPVHPISSLSLGFVMPVALCQLPTTPQPLCGSHQMVFAVNPEPILIFNPVLQRLHSDSLKGVWGLTERDDSNMQKKKYFFICKRRFLFPESPLQVYRDSIDFSGSGIAVWWTRRKKWEEFNQSKSPSFFCVTVQFTEWAACSKRKSTFMRLFPFYLVAEKKKLANMQQRCSIQKHSRPNVSPRKT